MIIRLQFNRVPSPIRTLDNVQQVSIADIYSLLSRRHWSEQPYPLHSFYDSQVVTSLPTSRTSSIEYSSSTQLCPQILSMAVFSNKKFPSSAQSNTIAARYRAALVKHPFALFGLPFIATMVAGSFFLTPATAVRYEKHDRKVQRLTKEDELGIGKAKRKVDMKEEYYVSLYIKGSYVTKC